jgi:hypothetical protein
MLVVGMYVSRAVVGKEIQAKTKMRQMKMGVLR